MRIRGVGLAGLIGLVGLAHGATVQFDMTKFTGGPNNRTITISQGTDPLAQTTNMVFGMPRIVQPTNGIANVSNLLAGNYWVQIDQVPKRMFMPVPDSTNFYNAIDLIIDGLKHLIQQTNYVILAGTGYVAQAVAGLASTQYVNAAVGPLASTGAVATVQSTLQAEIDALHLGGIAISTNADTAKFVTGNGLPLTNAVAQALHATNADNAVTAGAATTAGTATFVTGGGAMLSNAVAQASHATNADVALASVSATNFWGVLSPTNFWPEFWRTQAVTAIAGPIFVDPSGSNDMTAALTAAANYIVKSNSPSGVLQLPAGIIRLSSSWVLPDLDVNPVVLGSPSALTIRGMGAATIIDAREITNGVAIDCTGKGYRYRFEDFVIIGPGMTLSSAAPYREPKVGLYMQTNYTSVGLAIGTWGGSLSGTKDYTHQIHQAAVRNVDAFGFYIGFAATNTTELKVDHCRFFGNSSCDAAFYVCDNLQVIGSSFGWQTYNTSNQKYGPNWVATMYIFDGLCNMFQNCEWYGAKNLIYSDNAPSTYVSCLFEKNNEGGSGDDWTTFTNATTVAFDGLHVNNGSVNDSTNNAVFRFAEGGGDFFSIRSYINGTGSRDFLAVDQSYVDNFHALPLVENMYAADYQAYQYEFRFGTGTNYSHLSNTQDRWIDGGTLQLKPFFKSLAMQIDPSRSGSFQQQLTVLSSTNSLMIGGGYPAATAGANIQLFGASAPGFGGSIYLDTPTFGGDVNVRPSGNLNFNVSSNYVTSFKQHLFPAGAVSGQTLIPVNYNYSGWPVGTVGNGWVGLRFIATAPMTLTSLGKYALYPQTNKVHQILVMNVDGTTNAAVSIADSTTVSNFIWASCFIQIQAGVTNYILTDVATPVGDSYIDFHGPSGPWDPNISQIYGVYAVTPGSPSTFTTNGLYGALNYTRFLGIGGMSAPPSVPLSSIQQGGATPNQAIVWNGTTWAAGANAGQATNVEWLIESSTISVTTNGLTLQAAVKAGSLDTNLFSASAWNFLLSLQGASSNSLWLNASNLTFQVTNGLPTGAFTSSNTTWLNASNLAFQVTNGLPTGAFTPSNTTWLNASNLAFQVTNGLPTGAFTPSNTAWLNSSNLAFQVTNGLPTGAFTPSNTAWLNSSNLAFQVTNGLPTGAFTPSNTAWINSSNLVFQGTNGLNAALTNKMLNPLLVGTNAVIKAGANVTVSTNFSGGVNTYQVDVGTGGTVTSIGLTMPPGFNVTNSPITSSGSFNVGPAPENANAFAVGPSSGGAGPWTWRSIVPADLASADALTNGQSTVVVLKGGGLTITNTATGSFVRFLNDSIMSSNAVTGNFFYQTNDSIQLTNRLTGHQAAITNGTYYGLGNNLTNASGAGANGTVTSVSATVPPWMSVSGFPITGSGTLIFTNNPGVSATNFNAGYFQTNINTGAWLYIGTNSHLTAVDQYTNRLSMGTNWFSWMMASGMGFGMTNDTLYISSNGVFAGSWSVAQLNVDAVFGTNLTGGTLQVTNEIVSGAPVYLQGGGAYATGVVTVINAAMPPFSADATGATDSGARIQAALDFATNGYSSRVFLPAGRYLSAQTLFVNPYTTFEGEIGSYGTNTVIRHFAASAAIQARGGFFEVRKLYLYGGDVSNGGIGFRSSTNAANRSRKFKIEDLHCYTFMEGMRLDNVWIADINSYWAEQCSEGLVITNTSTTVKVIGGHLDTSVVRGLRCENEVYGCYFNTVFENNPVGVVLTNTTYNNEFDSCWFEGNGRDLAANGNASVTLGLSVHNCSFSTAMTNVTMVNCLKPSLKDNAFYGIVPWVADSTTVDLHTDNDYEAHPTAIINNSASSTRIKTSIVVLGGSVSSVSSTNTGLPSADAVATDSNGRLIQATAVTEAHVSGLPADLSQKVLTNDTRLLVLSGSSNLVATTDAAARQFWFTQTYPTTNNFPATPGAINVDWRYGLQFLTTNATFTIGGFINASNGVAPTTIVSVSNSAASAITCNFPAGLRQYGTNAASSTPVAAGKVVKITFSLDPHGTNLVSTAQSN